MSIVKETNPDNNSSNIPGSQTVSAEMKPTMTIDQDTEEKKTIILTEVVPMMNTRSANSLRTSDNGISQNLRDALSPQHGKRPDQAKSIKRGNGIR